MIRVISTAVQIRPPQHTMADLLDETKAIPGLRGHMPTEAEVRDGMMRLARDIGEMISARTAGQSGWTASDMGVSIVPLEHGEIALRGTVQIERAD